MSKKVIRYLIYILFVCVFAVFVFKLNQTEKTELVVRTGQTFEKAKVTEILQDNLASNGTRVGEQKVRVKMLTGARKGEKLDVTSSSGYLFGAACKVGMKVVVMQSVAGETTIASVYSQDREWVIYIFALSSCPGCDWWKTGRQGMSGVDLHIFLRNIRISSACIFAVFTFLVRSIYLFYYYTGHDVSNWRSHKKNLRSDSWYTGRCGSCRDLSMVFQ